MSSQAPPIDVLLNLVPERPQAVQDKLQAHPDLAHRQDQHGYSLVHASASYGHVDLLKALINDFKVDPNIKDEDGETALFSVEDVAMAQALLDLGTDASLRNSEGQTAAEKLADDDEQPAVAAYLRELTGTSTSSGPGSTSQSNGDDYDGARRPPPLPEGLKLNIGTMLPEEEDPNPEIRRRIEELAARDDFGTEEGQSELRKIISDALSGTVGDTQGPPTARRRLD
ncbi:Putative ankyrin repeat-containing domain superfamily [Septoria linicola]|uniref:Ankyrin repeat-containing domain superfamily n=1 Tax=Septoria linicola TaxID=215465 RepID=A0A9Q9AKI8_9PEZI|nr:Putative ankyrin repeat-containing domain superfamily [Septoria linicola]